MREPVHQALSVYNTDDDTGSVLIDPASTLPSSAAGAVIPPESPQAAAASGPSATWPRHARFPGACARPRRPGRTRPGGRHSGRPRPALPRQRPDNRVAAPPSAKASPSSTGRPVPQLGRRLCTAQEQSSVPAWTSRLASTRRTAAP